VVLDAGMEDEKWKTFLFIISSLLSLSPEKDFLFHNRTSK